MPLMHISLQDGKSASYRRAIADSVYEALRETFDVPEHDFFVTVTEHRPEDFLYDGGYLDIERSNDFVMIQLTVNNTRTVDQKKALYRRMVERLAGNPGLRPNDVFINIVEVARENWSATRRPPAQPYCPLRGGGALRAGARAHAARGLCRGAGGAHLPRP